MPKFATNKTRSQTFKAAFARVVEYRKFPVKKIARVIRWQKAVNDAMTEADAIYERTLKKYAKLDDNGNFEPRDGMPNTWQVDPEVAASSERMKEYLTEMEEFHKMEIDVEVMPLNFSEISKCELSPAEIAALEPLVVMDEA